MLSSRECAIISAYTGYLLGSFSEMQKYAEELLGRPVFTHEFGDEEFLVHLHELSKQDFISLSCDS